MKKDIKIICVTCKKEHFVTIANKNTKCCSRGCANTFRASKIKRPECSHCGNTVNRRLSHCYRNGGEELFCNKKCEGEFRKNRKSVTCDVCRKVFERRVSLLKNKKHTFCSKKCEYIGMHDFRKTMGRRYRSYGECAILNLLRSNFPSIQFVPNDRTQLYGYEIDIWVPSMKIGIEYNGPHHFKPVYGTKVFNHTQKSDSKKRKIADSKGIKIIDINVQKSVSYTHKSIVLNMFVELCKKLNLTPTVLDFDPKTVLEERNKSPLISEMKN